MRDVRDMDGHLACRIDEAKKMVEIGRKNCLTRIEWRSDGKVIIVHSKRNPAV